MISREKIEAVRHEQLRYSSPASKTWRTRREALLPTRSLLVAAPQLVAEWSSENILKPDEVLASAHIPALWSCFACETLYSCSLTNRAKGRGCPVCARGHRIEARSKSAARGDRSLAARAPEWLLAQWDPQRNELSPGEVSYGSGKYAWWLCPSCGHSWKSSIKNKLAQATGCPSCTPRSRLEGLVAAYLTERELPFRQNTFPLITAGGERLQLDFLLPSLAIEVQDLTTHSRESDTEPVSAAWAKLVRNTAPKKGPAYHDLKKKLTHEQLGLPLLELWEEEILSGSFEEIIAATLKSETPAPGTIASTQEASFD